MVLLIILLNILLLCMVLYGYLDKLSDAIVVSFVCSNAFLVIIAEILSLFAQYNVIGCVVLWVIGDLAVVLFGKGYIVAGCKKAIVMVKNIRYKISFIGLLCYVSIGIVAIIAILKAISYPPQNYDSMTYHLSRSFLYWKNESIHNMPFSYKWGLFTGPFNAILMTQLRICSGGSDALLNLIQLPAWLVAILACGRLVDFFCENEQIKKSNCYKYIGMLFMLGVPISLFQASTTQCDLLVASFSVITVYALVIALDMCLDKRRWLFIVSAGLAGGITLLAKVTGGIVLLVAGGFFLIIAIKRYKKIQVCIYSAIIGICGIAMTGAFWIRNAIELQGDFLAFNISFNLGLDNQQSAVSKLILNLGYLFGSAKEEWSLKVNSVVAFLYNLFLPQEEGPIKSFDSYGQYPSHDAYPYGIYMLIVFVGVGVALIAAISRKRKILFLYTLSCIVAWVITAFSVNYTPCISRYMLGALFMTLPLGAVGIGLICNFLKVHIRWRYGIFNVLLVIIWLRTMNDNIHVQLNDWYMPYPHLRAGKTYEELRTAPYSYKWDEPRDMFMQIIRDNKYVDIGFKADIVIGEYPILYQLRDSQYRVQYVDAAWCSKYENEEFVPDCIVYAGKAEEDLESIIYNNVEYIRCTEQYKVASGIVALYTPK